MLQRENVADVYPLTPFQEGLLLRDLIERSQPMGPADGARAYAMQLCFRLLGPLDMDAFDRAWQALIARHDILRTTFPSQFKDRPLQVLLKQCPWAMTRESAEGLDADGRTAHMAHRAEASRQRPLELDRPPLMRVTCIRFASDDHGVVWDFHHILMDGWCIGLIQRDLAALYRADLDGARPTLGATLPYARYVTWLEQQRRQRDVSRWAEPFAGWSGPTASVPGRRVVGPAPPRQPAGHSRVLSPQAVAALQSTAAAVRCTLGDALHALWGTFLGRINGGRDAVFGSVRSIRPADLPGAADLVGPCLGMVPVRVRWDEATGLSDLLQSLGPQRELWRTHAGESLPDLLAAARLPREAIGHFLVFENYPALGGGDSAPVPLSHGVTLSDWAHWALNDYDFFLRFSPTDDGGLRVDFEFDGARWDAPALGSLADSFHAFSQDAAMRPREPLDHLALLSKEAQRRVLQEWSTGAPAGSVPVRFGDRWRLLVDRDGRRPALRWGRTEWTYGELDVRVRSWAMQLRRRGAVGGDVVALTADGSPGMVVGMLACARLGAAFLPIDPQWSAWHRQRVLKDSGARWLLGPVPSAWRDDAGPEVVEPTDVAADGFSDGASAAATGQTCAEPGAVDPTAYIIYTSGTTGEPKGVAVGIRSLLNYTTWLERDLGIGPGSASLLLTSAAYDLGYTALFGTLFNGACLTLLDESERRDPDRVVACILEHEITFLKATPSYFSMLQASEAWQGMDPAGLRLQRILLGGEPQDFEALATLARHHPGIRVHNHYGPTEATIGCISGPLDDLIGRSEPVQRLGRPIPGAQVLITDSNRQPVPAGVIGEVLLGGAILAHGYCGSAATMAASRFIEAPELGAHRLYGTGDYAAWTPDGQVVFHGRRDDQVKVQGYRVHLGELAASARTLDGVRDAAVLLEGQGQAQQLVAFVVMQPGRVAAVPHWRVALQATWPRALIPNRWIEVNEIGLNANGKIDRGRLWAQAKAQQEQVQQEQAQPGDAQPGHSVAAGVQPSGPTEATILHCMRDLLDLPTLQPTDDFFEHGGHSLKAIRLASTLRRALDRPIPITAIFDHPSASALAAWLDARHGKPQGSCVRRLGGRGAARAHVVLFPTLMGTSSLLASAAPHMGEGIHGWALDCPEPTAAPPSTLKALAHRLAQAVQTEVLAAPDAERGPVPLVFVGWSFGAHLALEAALHLGPAPAGRRLSLVLMDIPPPTGRRPGSPSAGRPVDLQSVAASLGWSLTAEEARALAPTVERHLAMLDGHSHIGRLACDLLLLEATDSDPPTGMSGWKDWTARRTVHRMIEGTHHSIVSPSNTTAWVGAVNDWVSAQSVPDNQAATEPE